MVAAAETIRQTPWAAIRARLVESFIVFGMVVRPATPDDQEAVAGLLPEMPPKVRDWLSKGGRAHLEPRAVADRGIADGTLFLVEDDERNPMGVVRIARTYGGARFGWNLAPRALGKGYGAILAEGVTERLLVCGAETVWVYANPTAHGARRTLETLGYGVSNTNGRPLDYGVDRGMFDARKRQGTALLPTPAERRRGASENEQLVSIGPGEWARPKPPRPSVTVAFATPAEADGLVVRLATSADLDAVDRASPEAITVERAIVGASERRGMLARVIDASCMLIATDAEGMPVGSLSVAVHPDGRHELGWYVVPERRGEGIGTRMVEAAAGRLLGAGIGRLSCETDPGNAASMALAERIGFDIVPDGRPGNARLDLTAESYAARPLRGASPRPA